MAKVRKDKKGNSLRKGEFQRTDGRYSFTYTNTKGERKTIYAKELVELRRKEKQIVRDMEDGLNPLAAERISLNEIWERYIGQKYDLKPTTKANYKYMYKNFVEKSFGRKKIAKIRYSDVKEFYYSLLMEKGMKANTVDNVHTLLHPTFQMAVRDGILRVNPTDGVMREIKKGSLWVKPKRIALTIPQQKSLLEFLETNEEYSGWLPIITVLLGTGMRIGECAGLRWEDIDFENRQISVNHSLSYRPDENRKTEFHIQTPKTAAGFRTIPVLQEVYDAFLAEYEIQRCLGFSDVEIDGYSGFVFTTCRGNVYSGEAVNQAISRIITAHNDEMKLKEKESKEEVVMLPKFSCHNLRHTFCTRLCENETNLKVIQSIMGHSDISTTMDIYAECTDQKKQEVLNSLDGKIIIK